MILNEYSLGYNEVTYVLRGEGAQYFIFKNAILPVLEKYTNYVFMPDLILNYMENDGKSYVTNMIVQEVLRSLEKCAVPVIIGNSTVSMLNFNNSIIAYNDHFYPRYLFATSDPKDAPRVKIEINDATLFKIRQEILINILKIISSRIMKYVFHEHSDSETVTELCILGICHCNLSYLECDLKSDDSIYTITNMFLPEYFNRYIISEFLLIDAISNDRIYRIRNLDALNELTQKMSKNKLDLINHHIKDKTPCTEIATVLQYKNNNDMLLYPFCSLKGNNLELYC